MSFLTALKDENGGSIPANHAITKRAVVCAALYRQADGSLPGLSERALSDHLGVNRSYITKTLKILSASSYAAKPEPMPEPLTPDTDLSLPIDTLYDDEYDFELEHEHEHEHSAAVRQDQTKKTLI